jgi:hypothetical protein
MHDVQRRLHEQYRPTFRIASNDVSTTDLSAITKTYRNQAPLTETDFCSVWGGGTISKQLDVSLAALDPPVTPVVLAVGPIPEHCTFQYIL